MRRHFSEVVREASIEDLAIFLATRDLQEQEAKRERRKAKAKAEAQARTHGRR